MSLNNEDRIRDLYNGKGVLFGVKSDDEDDGEYEYYENEFFEPPAIDILEYDSLEQGAPGQYNFMELSANMQNINSDGLIKKRIIRRGLGQGVSEGAMVEIHYNGFWEGENISFDSSYVRSEPKKFIVGEGEVLCGLEEAVKSMAKGEEAQFLISYKLLFGERGCPPRVKPKADALFNIEVMQIIEHYKAINNCEGYTISFEQAYKCAESLRANGVESFKKNHLRTALNVFHQSVTVLEPHYDLSPKDLDMKQKLLIKLYTNLAVCYNKENKPQKVCSICKEIGKITNINNHCKILYQYGSALQKLGEYKQALNMLLKAKSLKPNDIDINCKLDLLKQCVGEEKKVEKELCGKIFGLKMKNEEQINIKNITNTEREQCINLPSVKMQNEKIKYNKISGQKKFYEKKIYKKDITEKFEKEIKATLDFFKTSKMKQLQLALQLSPNEVVYLEDVVQQYKFELKKGQPNKYVLLKKDDMA